MDHPALQMHRFCGAQWFTLGRRYSVGINGWKGARNRVRSSVSRETSPQAKPCSNDAPREVVGIRESSPFCPPVHAYDGFAVGEEAALVCGEIARERLLQYREALSPMGVSRETERSMSCARDTEA